ncbi:MAG: hypothetical protein AAF587_22710 [Bacteroidota bacterium]
MSSSNQDGDSLKWVLLALPLSMLCYLIFIYPFIQVLAGMSISALCWGLCFQTLGERRKRVILKDRQSLLLIGGVYGIGGVLSVLFIVVSWVQFLDTLSA